MKNFLLISVLMMSFSIKADEVDPNANLCSNVETFFSDKAIQDTELPGSTNFQSCDKLLRGQFKKLYRANGRRNTEEAFKSWDPYIEYACKDQCKDATKLKECKTPKKELARKCESIAYVMSFYERDWESTEQIQAVSGTAIAPLAAPAQGSPASFSSSIKCKSEGIETLDYIPCKEFATQLEIANAIQTTTQGAQELIYAGKMMDASAKYAKEENAATGALKATGESLSNQQDMYQQRTAIDATKLAYIYKLYTDFPKLDEMRSKCQGIEKQTSEIGLDKSVTTDDCKKAVLPGSGGFALAQNQSQLDEMKKRLVTIATSLGSNIILANLTGKRADSVNNAIAQIDSFKPTDPTIMTEEDTLTTYCKLNPDVEKCQTADLTRTFDTFNENIITFGEGATGTNYGSNNEGLMTAPVNNSGGISSPRKSVTPVGSIIASAARDNSIEDSKGATVTAGKGPSGGGGGGGGSAGGSGGGGGGAPPPAAPQGGVSAAVQGKTPSYAGGAGSISVVGGLGLNRAKGDGKSEDNPFGKLFGKDAPKGAGVVNFREIASQKVGDKTENLFHMISKRYSTVAADKRLLEYELAK